MPRIATACVAALSLAAVALAVWAWPQAFGGRTSYVITHGVSMEPYFHQGDLVVVRQQDDYRTGDVVAYRSDDLGTVVLHRIVGTSGQRLVVQGDNNSWLDEEEPSAAAVVGAEVLHVPRGGALLRRLLSPPALAGAAFLLFLGGRSCTPARRRRRHRRRRHQEPRTVTPRSLTGSSTRTRALSVRRSPSAAAAVSLAALGALVSVLAWTQPATTAERHERPVSSSMTFGYTAPVPRTAAYDTTVVTAPRPVFRRVVDRLDVAYTYTGPPGRLSVDLHLSTSSGWSSLLPAGPAAPVASGHRGSVPLDLVALERRAAAGAAATGLPASQVSVAVVPTVQHAGGGTFAPRFDMVLDRLTLRPTSELTVRQVADAAVTARQAAVLDLGPVVLEVATGRRAGAALLVLAAALLAARALLSGRSTPRTAAERARRRYGSLLLPVQPLEPAPQQTVVDLSDLRALAALAERYGLLVLTWTLAGEDTYLVQDEGTTYRFVERRTDPVVPEQATTGLTAGPPAPRPAPGAAATRAR